jgi:quercetin dioxygenase-like cupin family protein
MTGGWFVGDFAPTVFKTDQFEVGLKYYKKGDYEDRHVHKIAAEITVIVTGHARMNDKNFETGDIIVLEPGESMDFAALTDCSTLVVKLPSVKNDKYFV